MSASTLYTCDGCGVKSPVASEFNNGPSNRLIPDWTVASRGGQLAKLDERHYCRACIEALNKAINDALTKRSEQTGQ